MPHSGGEEIQLYMRTYYSLLRSSHTIQLEALVESHTAMESSLHINARDRNPDLSALIYSSLRFPACLPQVSTLLLGQLERSFVDAGYPPVETWERVHAPGRRRRTHYDADETLAVFIASRSDIDDLVPMLTAYQIEWNKLHRLLKDSDVRAFMLSKQPPLADAELVWLAEELSVDLDDLGRLQVVWGDQFCAIFEQMAAGPKYFKLRLLAGSLVDYRRATHRWWDEVNGDIEHVVSLADHPVYFVSSNTHSLVNLLTGFARREENALIDFVRSSGHDDLLEEYRAVQQRRSDGALDNFLYYVLKKYLTSDNEMAAARLAAEEGEIGIQRTQSKSGFELETQVIAINKLRADWLDPRLCEEIDHAWLAQSDALILNIDYPLGMAAYELLTRISEGVGRLLGVYVMGKAATLNGRIGDVMLPNVVHDEHSQNTFLFSNCFRAEDVASYLTFNTVLDNQKAISVPGTFLQNAHYMTVFYHEGYTDIEMEAGPYLSSIYEAVRPKRHPYNEIVTLHGAAFDIGFLHYASDTPRSKGHNLGSRNLSYAGVEPTYATATAILRRIFSQEAERMRAKVGAATAV